MRILIVDDHAHARDSLTRHCERSHDVQVVGEAACGRAAIDAADTLNPDVVLMDVELPDMSGFELLRAVGAGTRPLGIMVSSCPDHAVRAFAEGAIDYFVMPVTEERFDLAMARARHQFSGGPPGSSRVPSSAAARGPAPPSPPRFLVGERQRRLYPLDPRSVDYIEADGNYVTLRAGKVEYLSRDSIKHLSTELAALNFVRITRSLLVNAAAVLYAERAGRGIFALTLTCGACLHSSATYRDALLHAIPLPVKRPGMPPRAR
ncbi:MAG TPA: LytTR family DNA-binding domain-containing protein [Steroidobacteraceae bacterium]|nr:LytTR family DNA-binding domain-containing protein [Steroidobacteraceae bacterium]